jgi:hypothetical protein
MSEEPAVPWKSPPLAKKLRPHRPTTTEFATELTLGKGGESLPFHGAPSPHLQTAGVEKADSAILAGYV